MESVWHFFSTFAANNPKLRLNMKKTLFLLAALLPLSLSAQDEEGWSHDGLTGFNLSQTSFTNWSEGGENTVADNVYLNYSLNYKKGKLSWTNDLGANYGQNFTDDNGWRKSLDNINLASKFGHQITEKLYYAALLDFKSQFAEVQTNTVKVGDSMLEMKVGDQTLTFVRFATIRN